MRVSSPKQVDTQLSLLDGYGYEERVCTIAACRNYMGDFFEELTVGLLGGARLKTDATKDICPDIQLAPNLFIESKSVGRSGAIIVYECRLKKDLAFQRKTKSKIHYAFWSHNARIEDDIKLGELRNRASASVRSLTVVSLNNLHEFLKTQPVKVLNAKHKAKGYGAYGYNNGYQCRLEALRASLTAGEIRFASAYDREAGPFPIYADKASNRLL